MVAMPRMTPEQEAEYALDFGVARSNLREEVRLAYDRLVEQRAHARGQALLDRGAVMATSVGPLGGEGEASASAPMDLPPAKLRPGRGWYLVALAVFLAGCAWVAVVLVVVLGQVDSFPRVPDPGTGVLSLQRGGYVIYYEWSGATGGTAPPGGVNVKPLSGSAAVGSIATYSGSLTYKFGSREGIAVAVLHIDRPGRFLVRATSSVAMPGGHLAFGHSLAGWILLGAVPAAVLLLAGIAGAIAVAIIRHRRARPTRSPPLPS
jgi:hypothetical protein